MSRFTNLFQAPEPTPVKKVEVNPEVKPTPNTVASPTAVAAPTTVKVKTEETSK